MLYTRAAGVTQDMALNMRDSAHTFLLPHVVLSDFAWLGSSLKNEVDIGGGGDHHGPGHPWQEVQG